MINELLVIKNNLESWNINIPESFGGVLTANTNLVKPKKVNYFLLALFDEGDVVFSQFPEGINLYHYRPAASNVGTGIAFDAYKAKEWGTIPKRYSQYIKQTKDFQNNIHDNYLKNLIRQLQLVNKENFTNSLVKFMEENNIQQKDFVVICPDLPNREIQQLPFLKQIVNNYLNQGASEIDPLGASSFGSEKRDGLLVATEAMGKVRIYTRNDNNSCLARYGKNSVELFPLGAKSRSDLVQLVEFLFTKKHELKIDQPGIWYIPCSNKEARKKDKNKPLDIVISTLFPGTTIFDFPKDENEKLDNWKIEVSHLLEAYHQGNQSVFRNGYVIVARKFQDKSMNWQFVASETVDSEELAFCVGEWLKGCEFAPSNIAGNKLYVPTIQSVHFYLNQRYSRFRANISRNYQNVLSIEHLYAFFFGRGKNCLANALARHVRTLFEGVNYYGIFWRKDFLTLLALLYIVVWKETGGKTMSWSYKLGQLLGYSDIMYRGWFRSRGYNSPEMTLSQRYLPMIIANPVVGYVAFTKHFSACVSWYESRTSDEIESGRQSKAKYPPSVRYQKYLKMVKAVFENVIPVKTTNSEILQLYAGYYDPFREI